MINDFYTCHDVQTGEKEYSCRLVFNPAHAIFGGHFPGNPIVPGVCMIAIVKELLEQQVVKPLMLSHAGNAKFLQIIGPGQEPMVTISWKDVEGNYQVNAVFKSDSAIMFKLDGKYLVV